MVCQECQGNDPDCPDCEKHPHDIHTTPPGQYGNPPPSFDFRPIGTRLKDAERRIAQLEQDVHDLKTQVAALMMKAGI